MERTRKIPLCCSILNIAGRDVISQNKLLCRRLLQFYLSDLNDFPCIVY